ncbi:ABC transporter permease [Chitinimonas sp.]|uniref:ABC transporter permease n=1 Tax=Chitinimonas sp. TaxID=1934313 RepID=UPI0035AFD1EA
MNLKTLFLPNQPVSPSAMQALVGIQALGLIALWSAWPSALLPKPLAIASAWQELWVNQGLGGEIWASLTVNLQALALATGLSAVLAYLTVLPIMRPLVLLLSKLRFLGLTGLTLFFTLAASSGHALKVSLLVFGMSVFFVTALAQEVAATPIERLDHARSLRLPEWRVVWEVIIRGRLDALLEALRQNAAMGWMMLTMVEGLVRGEGGIGGLLLAQNKHLHLDAVVAIQLTVLLIGIAQDCVIGWAKRLLCPHLYLHEAVRTA